MIPETIKDKNTTYHVKRTVETIEIIMNRHKNHHKYTCTQITYTKNPNIIISTDQNGDKTYIDLFEANMMYNCTPEQEKQASQKTIQINQH